MSRVWTPTRTPPTIRRQRLGAELRLLREAAGLTGDQVIDSVGWAAKSKLSRIENGRSRADLADVLDLLDLYRVRGNQRDQLIAIAREAGNARGWMRAYAVMTPRQRGYAELEAASSQIREYAASIVPGLLQTPDYARVRILSSSPLTTAEEPEAAEPDLEVAARLARQTILRREPDAPSYEAILDEQVLLGRGAPADVRKGQIAHLCALTALPNVTIRILLRGASVGPHFVPYTGFSIYHFVDPGDPQTVAIEVLARELVVTDRISVHRYDQVYHWLNAAALDVAHSRTWLNEHLH